LISVRVQVDSSQLILRLEKGARRLAYAVANALNATARDIQAAERANVQARFEIRKPDFLLRQAAIIKPFASVRGDRPFVEISVGKKPRLLLSRFEEGGDRPAFKGQHVAVPITGEAARPMFTSTVPTEYRFSQLFGPYRPGRRRAKGKHGTYIVPGVGVFQRGPTGSDIIYSFEQAPHLAPRLGFLAMASFTTREHFRQHLRNETANAIIRSGGRGL